MNFTHGQIILLSCLAASALLTAIIVSALAQVKSSGTVIREQGPESHRKKAAIPSTGGRAFLSSLLLIGFPGAILMTDPRAMIAIAAGLLTGMIGLADDTTKLVKRDSSGLKARYKLPLQIIIGFLVSGAVFYLLSDDSIRIPFMKITVHIGWWKILVGMLAYLTIINAVNFTDGVDGLASSSVIIASIFLALAIFATKTGSVLIPVILAGISVGFLPFNWHPAKIFMGDSGALCISGALAAAAIASGLEIVMIMIGIVFIIEISTVVIQVVYFRLSGGKRIFRMTPIHHAWELRGFKEPAIVKGFCFVGAIGGLIGWLSA
ncbi:MAG: phospho-N-acetylmuramoyl-pentapeptide-transferase [bacterium]